MKKILLIGANGYFGSRLMEYFEKKNYEIVGLDKNYFKKCNLYKNSKKQIIYKCASKINENFIKNFTSVIAFAGFSNNPIFKKKQRDFHDFEFKYLTNIAKICKKNNIQYIFPSSCSLYGASKKNKLLKEDDEINPITHYSKNKERIENFLIKISSKTFKPIILRFSTLYGVSEKMRFDIVINMFCGSAITSNKIELNSDGMVNRPFIEITDACRAIFSVIKCRKKIKNQLFNVGSNSDNYKIIDVAKFIQKKLTNISIIFLKQNKKLVSDNIIKKGKDHRNYKVSFNKFEREFDFKTKYNINSGINKLLNDLKQIGINKKKFNSIKYYRLQYLEYLLQKKKLDKKMEWII